MKRERLPFEQSIALKDPALGPFMQPHNHIDWEIKTPELPEFAQKIRSFLANLFKQKDVFGDPKEV